MELVVLSGGERIALDLHIYDALAHTKEPGHISHISISFVTFAAGQSRHNSLNHIHPYEFKISRTSSSYRMKLWGFLRFEMNAHKPFSICGHSFQNELGFQRDGNSFGSYVSNRGGERPVGLWIQRGQRSLGSGFQRRRRCLGGWNPMEGRALKWQEESNETGGFAAHDFARKV